MTRAERTNLDLLREVVHKLNGKVSIMLLCDKVMRLAQSKGLTRVKRASILTTIRRCIVNRPGSHYANRQGQGYNPDVDLLWEVEYRTVVRLDPEEHLGQGPSTDRAADQPLCPVITQLRFTELEVPDMDCDDVADQPPPLKPEPHEPSVGSDSHQPETCGRQEEPGPSVAGRDQKESCLEVSPSRAIRWGNASPIAMSAIMRRLVPALELHEGPLRFAAEIPCGVRADDWAAEAVLVDAKGHIVLVVDIAHPDLLAATVLTKALMWGLGQAPWYGDARVIALLDQGAAAAPVLLAWNGADRMRFYGVNVTGPLTAPILPKISGDK